MKNTTKIILPVSIVLIALFLIIMIVINNRASIEDCKDYPYYNCPESCTICPPCEVCSSLVCQTEDFCENIGFNKSWYEAINNSLSQQNDSKCDWEPGQCKNICQSQNYYFDSYSKECKKYLDSSINNGCCTPPPFETLEKCKLACE